MSYFEENIELLYALQTKSYEAQVNDTPVTIKPIPDSKEGMRLDPRVYTWRKEASEKDNPLATCEEVPVDLVRQTPAYPSIDIVGDAVTVTEQSITTRNGQTPIFILKPEGGAKVKQAMLFIHGGAFIAGCTEVCIPFCKIIAKEADCIVIGVDYRLAPEHYFPVGLYDCYDTFCYMADHSAELGIDPNKLTVGGDSAGGTLALGVTMLEQEAVKSGKLSANRVKYQALVYPGVLVDNLRLPDYKWKYSVYEIPDEDELAMGAALSLKMMTAEMPRLYMGKEEHVTEPLAAPLCAEDLSYMPMTLTTICEYDYLRLQDEAFVRKLTREGVKNRGILYKGMDHEYIDRVGYCPQAYDTAMEIVRDLGRI